MDEGTLKFGRYELTNRLILGTGKFDSLDVMERAFDVAGTQMVTVAIRRFDLSGTSKGSLLDHIDTDRIAILPNTAGCYNAEDAVRTARLAREFGFSDLIKLEVLADPKTLLPDPVATLEALKVLVKEDFTVLTYTSDDPVIAMRLEEAGAAVVMPLGSPIGSGAGILNPQNIEIIIEHADVPIIVDAGVGTASDTAIAMELGADGVLMNTGVAEAKDPVRMARAMALACEAGRYAFLSGRIPKRKYAQASSPINGVIE
ncbi:MAG: thiazole synthase [Planctomycetota bacterium]